jgi:dipeptidyl aminopeptidase/acylaminoacyl peptidase
VLEVDLNTGEGSLVETGTKFTDDWAVTEAGDVVGRSEWDPMEQLYVVFAKHNGEWREVYRQQHQGHLQLLGMSRDGLAMIVSGKNAQQRATMLALPLDGSPAKSLYDDPRSGIVSTYVDPRTNIAMMAAVEGGPEKLFYLDPESQKLFKPIEKTFSGKLTWPVDHATNGKRILVEVAGPSAPQVDYLIDLETHKADIVGEEYPGLANVTLGEMRSITYKARDGSEVPAFLVTPPKSTGKHLPLVMLPHSRMDENDEFIFDSAAQFLASRGYAVLMPQYRGSSGFGEAWRLAGHKQWGKLAQDDISDGVRAMVDQGIADPRRVAIVGMEFGGYAALAGAAFTPDLYRCVVSINGLTDLPEFLAYQSRHWGEESDSVGYWRDVIGSIGDKDLIEKSPARYARLVKAPVLIFQSNQDTRVPLGQAEMMVRALKQYKKPVTFVGLDGEDHWLLKAASRERVYTELEKFLAANMSPAS